MGWLGLDDTDHLSGGCTTYALFEMMQQVPNQYHVQSARLVRLYPFASRRTRGNAAVAVEIVGTDYTELLTFLEGWWNEKLLPLKGQISKSDKSDRPQYPSDPGMVWFEQPPSSDFYWDCVTREVAISEVPAANKSWGGNGVIGATAAVAWPAMKYTYEAIAWRTEDSVAMCRPREVDLTRLAEVDGQPQTFMSRDLRTNSILISPRGNCPVLFGLRAKTYESAKTNSHYLAESKLTEAVAGILVFKTNQATDDHLPADSQAVVQSVTIKRRGTVKIQCQCNTILMAFAESGDVKLLAQWLKLDDHIMYNGLKNSDGTIHLEKILVTKPAADRQRPRCQECNVTLKSMGKNQPLRCPKCRKQFPASWESIQREPPYSGWVQPPKDSMRHLAKPITWP
tara:strand:+ start:6229 stop:7419 length:1191 start_codon:yes stop_codon:yes gene_type:complete